MSGSDGIFLVICVVRSFSFYYCLVGGETVSVQIGVGDRECGKLHGVNAIVCCETQITTWCVWFKCGVLLMYMQATIYNM